MPKSQKKSSSSRTAKSVVARKSKSAHFDTFFNPIESARTRAIVAVNTTMIDLYWSIGEHISKRISTDGWGKGTVDRLATYIQKRRPSARGFSASNLWRMMQFFETYRDLPILAPLVRELPWTHNLMILSRSKRDEEREFYLKMCIRERWGKRELERQLNGALFERVVLSPLNLAPAVRDLHPDAQSVFKDLYLLDFLDIPDGHSEADLQKGLVEQLRRFLIELGRDFCFVGSQYLLQVGGKDYFVDLLFYHRGLCCLVAIELKIEEFRPGDIGQLQFYLEVLDRKVKKPHEQPSIGVLLCATKNNEVVEYALSRTESPALVAEYQIHLPDKKFLERKLHEFYQLAHGRAAIKDKPKAKLKKARKK